MSAAQAITTYCRCWKLTRSDGVTLGFTDHDVDLKFDGVTFRADTGLEARALSQVTGLAVDNTEAFGALSASAIREEDVVAGRFDGAEIIAWRVDWKDVDHRDILFRGSLGEVTRTDGAFHAELRGLSERLNRPIGRVYQTGCDAILGEGACGVDLSSATFRIDVPVEGVSDARVFDLSSLNGFAPRWFERGHLRVVSGPASGLQAVIKNDRSEGAMRRIELWEALRADISSGDIIQLTAGCDKRPATCRDKFANLLNFRGFPHIPGDDWLMRYPRRENGHSGGSLNS